MKKLHDSAEFKAKLVTTANRDIMIKREREKLKGIEVQQYRLEVDVDKKFT